MASKKLVTEIETLDELHKDLNNNDALIINLINFFISEILYYEKILL